MDSEARKISLAHARALRRWYAAASDARGARILDALVQHLKRADGAELASQREEIEQLLERALVNAPTRGTA